MPKLKKITCFLCALLTVCSCSKEKNYFKDNYDRDTTITFDQLKDIALDPIIKEDNYTVKYNELGSNYDSYEHVPFKGSELYLRHEKASGSFDLMSIHETKPVASSLMYNIVYNQNDSGYTYLVNDGYVVYENSYPVVIYATTIKEGGYLVTYSDCYGKALISETVSSAYGIMFNSPTTTSGTITNKYFSIRTGSTVLYFSYSLKNDHYNVAIITAVEYSEALNNNNSSNEYLTPVYDKDGEIFSHYFFDSKSANIYVYDKDKKFLNNVNLSSFGFDSNYDALRIGKKICFFKNEDYYDNESERSSKETYKCKCLEINLSNGEVSYDDDFKYYYDSGRDIIYDEKYKYSYFTYFELNDKREKSDIKMCSIVKENLSFNKSFVYDGFEGKAYKLSDDAVLCSFNGKDFICSKDERKYLSNIRYRFIANNMIDITTSDSKHYICKRSNFINCIDTDLANNPNIISTCDYITTDRFYGDYIKLNYDSKNDCYVFNNYVIEARNVQCTTDGLIVTKNEIRTTKGTLFTSPDSTKINSVDIVFAIFDSTLYRVEISNGTHVYFLVEAVKA